MKSTKSTKTALERLSALVTDFVVTEGDERGRVLVGTRNDPWGLGLASKRYRDALAMLADHAKRLENADEIREAVKWSGAVPGGLASHEETALNWLQL